MKAKFAFIGKICEKIQSVGYACEMCCLCRENDPEKIRSSEIDASLRQCL